MNREKDFTLKKREHEISKKGMRHEKNLPAMFPARLFLVRSHLVSRCGTVSRRERCQSLSCLTFSFFIQMFKCSNVFSFLLPCSLFISSSFEGKNKNFYPHRAPHRDSDHRDSCGDAPAGFRQGKGKGAGNHLPFQCKAGGLVLPDIFQ